MTDEREGESDAEGGHEVEDRASLRSVPARADLVTEMKAVKHYYASGVKARTGIEK